MEENLGKKVGSALMVLYVEIEHPANSVGGWGATTEDPGRQERCRTPERSPRECVRLIKCVRLCVFQSLGRPTPTVSVFLISVCPFHLVQVVSA